MNRQMKLPNTTSKDGRVFRSRYGQAQYVPVVPLLSTSCTTDSTRNYRMVHPAGELNDRLTAVRFQRII